MQNYIIHNFKIKRVLNSFLLQNYGINFDYTVMKNYYFYLYQKCANIALRGRKKIFVLWKI